MPVQQQNLYKKCCFDLITDQIKWPWKCNLFPHTHNLSCTTTSFFNRRWQNATDTHFHVTQSKHKATHVRHTESKKSFSASVVQPGKASLHQKSFFFWHTRTLIHILTYIQTHTHTLRLVQSVTVTALFVWEAHLCSTFQFRGHSFLQ